MAIKLSDIAVACGVDISTASRALRADPRVKMDTQKRVRAMAKSMGYRPNLLARSLAAGRTNMVAIIVHGLDPGTDNLLYDAASRYLQERGYMSIIMAHHGSISHYERMLEQLGQGLVDGVIVIAGDPTSQQPALSALHQQMPIVCLDRGLDNVDVPLVTGEHEAAIGQLIASCRAKGVTTFISGYGEHNTAARARSQAVASLLRPEEIISIKDLSEEKLRSIAGPCAFLVSTQWHIDRIIQQYSELLKSMEYYVACFDQWRGDCFPAQCAFVAVQDFDLMAKRAVELCAQLIENPSNQVSSTTVPMKDYQTVVSSFV